MNEFDIYKKIGQLLYRSSPECSVTLVMRAELSKCSDVSTLFFDYIDDKGTTNWFLCPPSVNHELSMMLAGLRSIFIEEERGFWFGLVFRLDMKIEQFNVDFKFEEK
jgi:hypothetical protein